MNLILIRNCQNILSVYQRIKMLSLGRTCNISQSVRLYFDPVEFCAWEGCIGPITPINLGTVSKIIWVFLGVQMSVSFELVKVKAGE